MNSILVLVGRILLVTIFLFSILGQMMDLAGTQAYMAQYGMKYTGFFLVSSLMLRIVGCLCVLLGYRTRTGVALLVAFLIPTTLIFHTNFHVYAEILSFLQNCALLGGLLILAGTGPGKIAVRD